MRAALIALLLSGCATSIDLTRAPPADWPTLNVAVFRVPESTVKKYCGGLLVGYACTVPDFHAGHCNVYLASDDPAVFEHEKQHCRGYDHPGESAMRDSWARWKSLPK